MQDKLELSLLLDYYGAFLTEARREILSLSVDEDLSLGEIAENFNISRQAVYDNIKRTENILESYEAKLHLYAEFQARNRQADEIQQYVRTHYPDDARLNELVGHLESLEEE